MLGLGLSTWWIRAREYLQGTFRLRRILLVVLMALSVVLGPFTYFLPFMVRLSLVYVYSGIISLTWLVMLGSFKNTVKSVAGLIYARGRPRPREFTPEEARAYGVGQILGDLGISKKVRLMWTEDPGVKGPCTNLFTRKVYVPLSWLSKFPDAGEMRGILGHELAHIGVRRTLWKEFFLGACGVAVPSILVSLFSTEFVTIVFELSLLYFILTQISWRNEIRADVLGAKATGPSGLLSVLRRLAAESNRDEGSETHPPLARRIKALCDLFESKAGPDILG